MDQLTHYFERLLNSQSIFAPFLAIALAYLGGVLSSLTPCIYPILPITVGYIGAHNERTYKDGFILSLSYVLGISVIYTALGLFASLSGKIFGSFTQTSGWYITLSLIITISSLWMMDVFHFDPQTLFSSKRVTKAGENRATLLGAFGLGLSSGFIAAPCTTPILTSVLSLIATRQSYVFGASLMFAFAFGLGTLLILAGTFTAALKLLPRSGQWMITVKKASGALLLGLGLYFMFKAGSL